jgi:hypothetical protein
LLQQHAGAADASDMLRATMTTIDFIAMRSVRLCTKYYEAAKSQH